MFIVRALAKASRERTKGLLVNCGKSLKQLSVFSSPSTTTAPIRHSYLEKSISTHFYSTTSKMPYTPKSTSRYAKTFEDPQGPGDARPTALDIVKDEGLEGKLTDKVMLITGCSSDIDIETARAMAATGARLFLGVRNTEKGESTLKGILKPGHIEMLKMDLNSLESVGCFACSHPEETSKHY